VFPLVRCDRMAMPDEAAYARNWWRILLTDALLGAAAVAVGVWRGGALLVLSLIGLVYIGLVGRRALKWRRLRREGGLGR
jgi:hypothetical protein